MAEYYLGIDVGTSGTKALLLSETGKVRGTTTASHASHYPKPGWSEQKPDDWWASACRAIKALLRQAKVSKKQVAGVGLSGQMHGSVFLDGRQRVVCNALLWNDQRTGAECEEIEQCAGGRAALIELVQNVALTGYTAPKILWLRKHKPSLFKRVRTVVLPKDYINYRLTGELRCEVSDASGTLLFDVARRCWSTALMDKLELDPALFPETVESADVIGAITAEAAKATGLPAGIPVVAGAGDQAAAAVGTGVVRKGIVSATMGTSGVVFAYNDQPVPNDEGLLQSFCHAVPQAWCVFGCMLSAGGSLQWAREVFYADRLAAARSDKARDAIYTAMIEEAAASPPSDSIIFHPYLTGERCPYPHPHARGSFIGSTRADTRGVLVRAVLEGITLGMQRQLEIMQGLGVKISEVRLAGGGARNAWWRQLQADVYGAKCVAMQSEEGSALGAALLAAVGAGGFKTVPAAAKAATEIRQTLRPDAKRHKHYTALGAWMRATYEHLEPLYRSKVCTT